MPAPHPRLAIHRSQAICMRRRVTCLDHAVMSDAQRFFELCSQLLKTPFCTPGQLLLYYTKLVLAARSVIFFEGPTSGAPQQVSGYKKRQFFWVEL